MSAQPTDDRSPVRVRPHRGGGALACQRPVHPDAPRAAPTPSVTSFTSGVPASCSAAAVAWSTSTRPPLRSATTSTPLSADERATIEEREHVRKELDDVVRYASGVYRTHRGAGPEHVLVAGRMPEDLSIASPARIDAVRLTHEQTERLAHDADVSPIAEAIDKDVDLVVLNQLLEACPRASEVAADLAARLPDRGDARRRLRQRRIAARPHHAPQLEPVFSLEGRVLQLREPAQHARARGLALRWRSPASRPPTQ